MIKTTWIKRLLNLPLVASVLMVMTFPASAQEPKGASKPTAQPGGKIAAKLDAKAERGKYLVEEVARCQECHTPVLPDGSFDKANWMKGATLVGIPATPIEDWHQKAPDITSTSKLWERWKVEGFVKFLQTAKTPKGGKAGPPMPAYSLRAEDAEAVTAYLKSLP